MTTQDGRGVTGLKRLIAVGVLTLFIVVVCVVGHLTIESHYAQLSENLKRAYSAAEQEQPEAAAEAARKTEALYVKAEGKMTFFVDHTLVEELGVSISRLCPLAEAGDLKEFRAECMAAQTRLRHILNDERLTFVNVF